MKPSEMTNRIIALILILVPAFVHADGSYVLQDEPVQLRTKNLQEPASINSTQVSQERLPPVIPGEEITRGGKKYKVWSTSGPVPVSRPPEPWKSSNNEALGEVKGGVGVVLDQRAIPSPTSNSAR